MGKLESLVRGLKKGSIEDIVPVGACNEKSPYEASCVATGEAFRDSCMSLGDAFCKSPRDSFSQSCMGLGPFGESCLCIGKK